MPFVDRVQTIEGGLRMRLRIASLYRPWMDEGLVRFLEENGVHVLRFSFFDAPPEGRHSNKIEVLRLHIWALVKLAIPFLRFRREPVLCLGGHYSWLAMTRLFGPVLPVEYHLFLYNFYLHALGQNRLVKAILHLLLSSPRVTVIAQSPQDQRYFAAFTKNPPIFLPYCEEDYAVPVDYELVPEFPYFFAGGYSNRDYAVVLGCAKLLPDVKFVVAASRLNKDLPDGAIPENVTVFYDLDSERFHGLLEMSRAVIIPLKENVGSSGQMVCLAAMRFGRPVIYSDISAVNYFFVGSTGALPYELGDVKSLISAVTQVKSLDPAESSAIGQRLRQHFLDHYTPAQRNSHMLELVTQER